MPSIPVIAIVGRPNVGKSAIFNRMVGRRIAIVHDEPGVTRDRITAPCTITQHACNIIDTGGIGATLNDEFAEQVATEADIAMQTANLILFVLDCRDHLTPIDINIAKHLRKSNVPVLLVLNKADTPAQDSTIGEFASLGFEQHVFVSAAHGRGMEYLSTILDNKLKTMEAPTWEDFQKDLELKTSSNKKEETIKVAVVGRPNAGKSSLVNAILKDERTIVSNIAGTTRDAIDIPYVHDQQSYLFIDTAGMRQRSKRDTSVEVFSAMRSEKAIRRSDICLLVIDIAAGITQQDRRIAGIIAQERKPCIIVVNKFDLFHPNAPFHARKEEVEEQIQHELFFVNYAPLAIVSASKGQGIEHIFKQILSIRKAADLYPSTGLLNRIIQQAVQMNSPAPAKSGNKRLKIYYATIALDTKYTTIPVPVFVLFVNDKKLLQENYAQYLRQAIRHHYAAPGIPIVFSPRSRIRND